MRRLAMLAALLTVASGLALAAQPVFLSEEISLDFEPAGALFLARLDSGPPQASHAIFMTPPNRSVWVFGSKTELPDNFSGLETFLLIHGTRGEVRLVGPRRYSASDPALQATIDSLRERLLQRKGVLKSFALQVKAQGESLNRLRNEADQIGDLGRIVDVKDEIEQTKASIKALEKDMADSQASIRVARTRPQPQGQTVREAQLVKQTAMLAVAARDAEATERQRQSQSQLDLEERLGLIEQTREDDLDSLQRELIELQRQRLSAGSPLDNKPEAPEDYLQ